MAPTMMDLNDTSDAKHSGARRSTIDLLVLPGPDERVSDAGLAKVLGWSGAATVAQRRTRGAPLPEGHRVGRRWWFSGQAIREWIDSEAAAEPCPSATCATCRRLFVDRRALAI